MNNTSNITGPQCPDPVFIWYENPFNLSMFVLYVLLIGTALIGNILVCTAVVITPNLRQNIASYFIVSLAISDIFTASLSMPFETETFVTFGRWYHSELLCDVWNTIYLITVPTSMWNLVILSIDRYKTLKNPWDRFKESPFMTKRRAGVMIALVWVGCIGPVIGAQMGWKFWDGGSLIRGVRYCHEVQCIANVSVHYIMMSNVLNFYLPMFAMCCLYYKIYQIARTQYLSRPKSAMLELKSGDSKGSNKSKPSRDPSRTGQRNSTVNNLEELGHINVAVDVNDGPKMTRCGTMIEEIGEDNDKDGAGSSQDMCHADAVDERRAVESEGNMSNNDFNEQCETENHECNENNGSIDADKSLEDERPIEENEDHDATQNTSEENDILQSEESHQQDNESRIKPQEIPLESHPVVKEDYENEKNNQASECLDQEVSSNDVADDDDNNKGKEINSAESMDPSRNCVATQSINKGVNPDTSKLPSQDALELDGGTSTTPNANLESSGTGNNNSSSTVGNNAHHVDHHTNRISLEMHDYLRRKVSGEYKMKYASRESIESTCTVQSNLPDYRNSTLTINMPASRDSMNAFGSMEDLTKRRKILVKNKKAARTIAIIVGAFLVCWLPITTLSMLLSICMPPNCAVFWSTSQVRIIIVLTRRVVTFIAYISCAINPLVYSYRNLHFRNSYRKMIRKMCPNSCFSNG